MPPIPNLGRAIELNQAQVAILKVLARFKSRQMSADDIQAKCPGVNVSTANLGVAKTYVHPGSLYERGYVSAEEHPDGGRMRMYYRITRAGLEVAARAKTIVRSYAKNSNGTGASVRIPSAVLDGVVIRFRPTRTYGIDAYTDDDIQEIKDQLKGYADDVPIADIRQLIANRRKQGAYSNPAEKVKRFANATIKAFGPGGWISPDLLSDGQLMVLRHIAETGEVEAQ